MNVSDRVKRGLVREVTGNSSVTLTELEKSTAQMEKHSAITAWTLLKLGFIQGSLII